MTPEFLERFVFKHIVEETRKKRNFDQAILSFLCWWGDEWTQDGYGDTYTTQMSRRDYFIFDKYSYKALSMNLGFVERDRKLPSDKSLQQFYISKKGWFKIDGSMEFNYQPFHRETEKVETK